jgi:hypothetical protein
MIGEKELHYQGKGTDLGGLQAKIEAYLQGEGFTVQTSPPSEQGTVIQAKKGGFLSGVIAADRALTITVTGDASDFTVKIGIGKWLEHLGVTAAEVLLLSPLFLAVDVPEMAWNLEVENKLAKEIETYVG